VITAEPSPSRLRDKVVGQSWVDVRGDLILVANLAPTATADDDVGILGELAA
jgi:hypothetical protein